MAHNIYIDFRERVDYIDVVGYKKPREIKWNYNRANRDVIGIYFKKEYAENPKNRQAIHMVLWYFGAFEDDDETDVEDEDEEED